MTFQEGERIECPGTRADRRDRPREGDDRRMAPRSGPCNHRWGRVGQGVTCVRVRQTGQEPWVGPSSVLDCPTCHQPIEFATVSARAA
jgi:hypothetical protein